jgi:hypothetical protein
MFVEYRCALLVAAGPHCAAVVPFISYLPTGYGRDTK